VFIILELTQEPLNISFINRISKLFKYGVKTFVKVFRMQLIIIKGLPSLFHILLDILFKVFLVREIALKGSGNLLTSFEDAFQLVYWLALRVKNINLMIGH
jgi:hypothetical protein